MPSPIPGVKPWIGNPNPVTLVATVVAENRLQDLRAADQEFAPKPGDPGLVRDEGLHRLGGGQSRR